MNSRTYQVITRKALVLALACAFFSAATLLTFAARQPQSKMASQSAQKQFDTPKAAADALIQAAGNFDVPAMLEILGPDGKSLVVSEDSVRDKSYSLDFAARAREKNSIAIHSANPNRAILVIGNDEWPMPVPIVKTNGKWHFESKEGEREILCRRVGTNELDAIQSSLDYVQAQNEYALEIHDNSGVNQYAQRIISTPGKHDGLYWKNSDGTAGGPLSEEVAHAIDEGYTIDQKSAYHGYYFKILSGQGPAAPLGELNYVIEGAMIGGFALIATPAEYRVTGVQTFIVSNDGIVYQKDLGADSVNVAKKIDRFNPDKTWRRTDDSW
jgi:hypothetical protein